MQSSLPCLNRLITSLPVIITVDAAFKRTLTHVTMSIITFTIKLLYCLLAYFITTIQRKNDTEKRNA